MYQVNHASGQTCIRSLIVRKIHMLCKEQGLHFGAVPFFYAAMHQKEHAGAMFCRRDEHFLRQICIMYSGIYLMMRSRLLNKINNAGKVSRIYRYLLVEEGAISIIDV